MENDNQDLEFRTSKKINSVRGGGLIWLTF